MGVLVLFVQVLLVLVCWSGLQVNGQQEPFSVFVQPLPPLTGEAGEMGTLTCTVVVIGDTSGGTLSITWSGPAVGSTGVSVATQSPLSGGTASRVLTFDPLRESHDGDYTCLATFGTPGMGLISSDSEMTTVTVTLNATNIEGSTLGDMDMFMTAPDPPRNFRIIVGGPTILTFSWDAPDLTSGNPSAYDLTCTPTLSGIEVVEMIFPVPDPSERRNETVTNFEEGVTYNCSLRSRNEIDNSSLVCVVATTNPIAPSGPPQMFTVTAEGSRNLLFTWRAPDPGDRNGDITSYTLSCSLPAPSVTFPQTIGSDMFERSLSGFTPFTDYTCTLNATNSEGNGPAATDTVTTLQDVPGSPGNFAHITTPSDTTRVEFSWDSPSEPNGIITSYIIRCLPTLTNLTDVVFNTTTDQTNTTVSGFTPASRYTCTIAAYTIVGEGPETAGLTVITSPTVCIAEFIDTIFGSYTWPDTTVGDIVDLRCELGSVSMDDSEATATRMCGEEGVWMDPDYSQCADTFDLLEDMNITSDNYEQVISNTSANVEIASANPADQNEDNIAAISSALDAIAVLLVEDPTIVVDVQTVNETVEILDILQEWNATVVATEGANIVESFESIVSNYSVQENFTELVVEGENLAFVVERLEVQTLIESGRGFSLAEENGTLITNTAGGAGTFMELARDKQLATVFLPPSLFAMFENTSNVGVFFSLYQTAVLFPLGGEARVVGPGGADRIVGSPVVAATVAGQDELRDLPDPVSILLRLNNLNDTAENIAAVTCVSYDFDAAGGRGNWTSEGCVTEMVDDGDGVRDIVNCLCNHLTNFAVLVDICSRTGSCGISSEAQLALDVISIVGVVFSLIGIIGTIFTLLVFKKLRQRDATKYHIQLCIALFCMLLVFVIGIDQTDVSEGCVTVSVLIHYFTLVAVMWMGAEATHMFQKLVIIFVRITTRYIVILSLVCWLVPIIPALIPTAIDWEDAVSFTDSGDIDFCFISDTAVFFGAFLGPILAVMAFNLFIMCIVVFVLIRHIIRTQRRKGEKKIDMKIAIRLLISITGVMFLFGLTWVFGALTVAEASLAFQILFALFNSFQGFFIFLFFVVFSKDAREAWKEVLSYGRYTSTTLHPSHAKNTSSIPVLKRKSTTATLMGTGGTSSLPQSEAPSGYDSFAELAALEPGSSSTFDKGSTEKETNVDSVDGEAPGLQVGRETTGLKARIRRYSTKYEGKHHVEIYEVDFEVGDDDDETGFPDASPA